MNLTEFGQLVKTLRNNSIDGFGNRQTRENLSEYIHLTPHQLGRLERGDRKYLDTQTLQFLAESFNLTNLEQKEFYSAAVGLSDSVLYSQVKPATQLNNLITLIERLQVPAYIVDAYTDMLAVNTSALKLYQITPDVLEYARNIPLGFNIINYLYSSALGIKDVIGYSNWRETANLFMLFFRRSTLRFRHTEYFNYIMKLLLKEKQFDIDWYSSHRYTDLADMAYQYIAYKHPLYGLLNYFGTETVINTNKGNLYLLIFNPSDAATHSLFAKLLRETKQTATRLAPWPEMIMV